MADATLKEAMAEIKEILRRYDIAGAVHLVSPTHSHYFYEIACSWALVTLHPGAAVFRAKAKDFDSEEAQIKAIQRSMRLLLELHDLAAQDADNMDAILKGMRQRYGLEDEAFADYEPHREH